MTLDGTTGWRDQAAGRLATIIASVLTLGILPASPEQPLRGENLLVNEIDRFLMDNLARQVTLSDLAVCFNSSVSSITHQYKALTGVTVGQRISTIRMEQAAALLIQTDLSLTAICAQTGAGDRHISAANSNASSIRHHVNTARKAEIKPDHL